MPTPINLPVHAPMPAYPCRPAAALACLLWLGGAAAAEPQAFSCLARCATECAVEGLSVSKLDPKPLHLQNCQALRVRGDVRVDVLYRLPVGVARVVVTEKQPVSTLVAAAPPGPCGLFAPDCLQKAQSAKQTPGAGHGVDGRVSKAGGEGQPCLYGMPCGRILPPMPGWTIRLVQPQAAGRVQLRSVRTADGSKFSIEQPFSAGLVRFKTLPAFSAGSYSYQVLDGAGQALLSGEFNVLSAGSTASLEKRAQARIDKGEDADLAWFAELGDSELDWDLGQWVLAGGRP